MNKHIIYEFVSPSGKRYIGRTGREFDKRLAEHKYRYNTVEKSWTLYDALKKYGWDNFEKNIIEEVDIEEEAIEREKYYIEKYDTLENGYNMTDETGYGGDNVTRIKEEEPERFEELRESYRLFGEDNGMYGKTHTEETKKKLKKKAAGRFSLPWYIERYGEEEGTERYNKRCKRLSERSLKRDNNGRFTKKGTKKDLEN